MLEKFGLVASTAAEAVTQKILAQSSRLRDNFFVLIETNQCVLDFPEDSWPVVVSEGRKLPRVIVQFFHLAECALSVERSKLEEDFKVTRMNSLGSIVVS